MSASRLHHIAIAGAAGNIGQHITCALLESPHRPATITVLTRESSNATFPKGVVVRRADTDSVDSVAAALVGADAFIIASAHTGGAGLQERLIDAAAQAGVRWVLPGEFGSDTAHPTIEENPINGAKRAARDRVAAKGMRWIAVATSAWYEFALPLGLGGTGVDVKKREADLFDDGNLKLRLSSMAGAGRAIAAIITLPVTAPAGSPSLEGYANGHVYISDLAVTQNEILSSIQRATKTSPAEWKVSYKPSKPIYDDFRAKVLGGDHSAIFGLLFTTVLTPGHGGQFEGKHIANEELGLRMADIDTVTRAALAQEK